MPTPQLAGTDPKKVLGSFLFTGDDVDEQAVVLSGGEKTSLALETLLVSEANLPLPDESKTSQVPTSRE